MRAVARPPPRQAPPLPPRRLSNLLHRHFELHTANIVGEVAADELEDVASSFANACISMVPVISTSPPLKLLARELAKRFVRQVRAKNRVAQLVQRCGPRQAAALLALSVATFVFHIAQQWGSPMAFEDVVTLLLENIPLIAGFITGRNVNLGPLLERLLPPPRRRTRNN